MEGHCVLAKHGFDVRSFGTGSAVRLPGPSADKPNIYQFGTPYQDIYADLVKKDEQLYTQNGLLTMLDRNKKIKEAPERFQGSRGTFDVIITCEERCFDAVCEGRVQIDFLRYRWAEMSAAAHVRGSPFCKRVHVVNVEINDNHRDASVGGEVILDLATRIQNSQDLDQEIETLIEQVQAGTSHSLLYSTSYY
ncbi:hypothetical protein IWQ60_010830 [Tieghemiomyces parasiticus]|uniref:RNA polymerase II subunit A C-terminal domain phosphatase SSU72 n=1 Tax=Tieghemiomyces parasiticus TaxID=78921 RepID=A0A9W7ZK23_9FUNG|nr:hypothetical protein IWQ60_010830 [Tieghemiomyces parasiticus]